MPDDSNNTAGSDCPSTSCSVIDSPEAELRYLKEVAKANGFESVTDAISKAKRYKHALNLIADTNSNPEGWASDSQIARHYLGQNDKSPDAGATE